MQFRALRFPHAGGARHARTACCYWRSQSFFGGARNYFVTVRKQLLGVRKLILGVRKRYIYIYIYIYMGMPDINVSKMYRFRPFGKQGNDSTKMSHIIDTKG